MSQLGCLHSSLSGRQLVCRTERQPAVQRHTLQIVSKDSRIGKAPVTVPKGVTVTLKECYIHVKVGRMLLKPLFLCACRQHCTLEQQDALPVCRVPRESFSRHTHPW